MKKALKIFGFLLAALALIIALVAAWVQLTPMPKYEVKPPQVVIPTDSATLERGKIVAELVCAHCHLGEDGKMSGRLFSQATDPFGEMWTSNITQHPTKGAMGRYSDGELAYLVRTGINREGRVVCMPPQRGSLKRGFYSGSTCFCRFNDLPTRQRGVDRLRRSPASRTRPRQGDCDTLPFSSRLPRRGCSGDSRQDSSWPS